MSGRWTERMDTDARRAATFAEPVHASVLAPVPARARSVIVRPFAAREQPYKNYNGRDDADDCGD
jgi:hypothetical protein